MLILNILVLVILIAWMVAVPFIFIKKQKNHMYHVDLSIEEFKEDVIENYTKLTGKIEALEKGSVPDFEAAQAAVNSLNDFNRGISNLLGYDPMESLKKSRDGKEA